MIYASLGLDWSQYARGLNDAAKSTSSAFNNITKSLASGDIKGALGAMGTALSAIPAPLVAVAAAAAGVGIAAKGMWDAMDKAKNMNLLAEQSGMTATQFYTLSKMFGRVGIDAEQLPTVMSKMAASMSTISDPASAAGQALAKMGISVQEMAGKNQYEQFKAIAAGIGNVTSATERMNIARTIFGRSGAQLLPGMKIGEIQKIETKGSPVAQMAEDMGGAFAKFQGTVKALHVNVGDFFLGMAVGVVPALQEVVNQLNKIDLTGAGKALGDAISFWVNYFKDFGTTGDLIANTLKLAFKNAFGIIDEELTAKVQAAMDKLDASAARQREAAAALKPELGGGLELAANAGRGGGGIIGLPDISSLQKVGGGSALLSGGQDNSPAYQSVRIQEDIREYMKTLIDVVKQGGQDYQIAPSQGGMVLTA